jgi:hypothetical protein
MPPIEDAAALAAEAFKAPGKPKADRPGPVGVPATIPASDGAYVDPAKDDVPAGEKVAAQSMIDAMKKGDAGAMARAMKDFVAICYPSLADAESDMEDAGEPGEE